MAPAGRERSKPTVSGCQARRRRWRPLESNSRIQEETMMKRTIALICAPLCLAFALGGITPAGARRSGPGDQENLASGQQLFMRNCARCHGANARGKNGPRLAGTSLSLGTIENTVTNGGSKMPSFKKQLSPTEIKAVAAYVRSLGAGS